MKFSVDNVIKTVIRKTLQEIGFPESQVSLEHPAIEVHGDYSSNVALATFEQFRIQNSKFRIKSPRELAEKIVGVLSSNEELKKVVSRIEVAGPGFINFMLAKNSLFDELKRVGKEKDNFGKGESLNGKKIMVEFTDPNPFKEFHIGHLFSNAVGESLCRLFESQAAIVKRVNYQGDVGMHVAKSVWGMMQKIKNRKSLPAGEAGKIKELEKLTLAERAKFLGQAYAFGATAFEEDEQAKKEITELNKKIYEKDSEVMELYNKGRQWSLDYFETIYKRLGTKFEFYYFESQAGKVGLEIVKENLKKGIFLESEGAIVYPGEKYGFHRRVFVNSLGLPTYEAKDLGLAPTKYRDFPYDESVIVTGNEINEYFRVVISALKQINPELGAKAHHLSHGMVRLPEGKMSSRTGKVLIGEWLLDEVKRLILQRVNSADSVIPKNEREIVADQIAVGAVKYALLKAGIGHDVVFDFGKSVSLEGNSGPYLQYTYARAKSVLAKAGIKKGVSLPQSKETPYQINQGELAILRWIYRFPEVVTEAAKQYAPNLVCTFLYELAQRFNTFYNKHRILEGNKKQETRNNEQMEFRLVLTAAVGQVLKNGLSLLGIQTPEKM